MEKQQLQTFKTCGMRGVENIRRRHTGKQGAGRVGSCKNSTRNMMESHWRVLAENTVIRLIF